MSEPRMIDCEEVMRMLFSYLDGEVSDEHRSEMDHHLALCRSCFSRAEFEKRLRAHLADLREGAVSKELDQRIRSIMSDFS